MGNRIRIAGWAVVVLSIFWTVVVMPTTHNPNPQALFILALAFLALHGWQRYGVRGVGTYVLAALVISNVLENSSILTGFPFGRYRYTSGPKLFEVPLVVGPFYVAIGYLSWQTANALLQQADLRMKKGGAVFLLPAVAAAVMTMYDLVTDPKAATIVGFWVWDRGGGYFGVPYTNFLGWWFVTYLFFQVFAWYLRVRAEPVTPDRDPASLLQAIVLYFNLGFTAVVDYVAGLSGSGTYTDEGGATWRAADIQSGMLPVFVFTCAFVSFLAIAELYGLGRTKEPRDS